MKKQIFTLTLVVISLISSAQEFTNYYSGYRSNYSVVTDDSLVYVGCENAINVFYKNGGFKEIIHVNGSVFSSVKDKTGNLWFAVFGILSSQSGGVIKYDGENFDFISVDNGFVERGVNAITCDTNNIIWVTITPFNSDSQAIIAKYDGTEWTNYHVFGDTVTLLDATLIVCDTNNVIYAGISSNYSEGSNGIISISETDTIIYTASNSNLLIACKHSAYVDRSNNVWFGGCYKRLTHFDGEQWHPETEAPGSSYYAIFQDTSEIMWFGTPMGLHVENDTGYVSYYKGENLTFDYIFDIESDNEDNIWMATSNNPYEEDVRMGCVTKFDEDGFYNYFPNTHIGMPKQISFLDNKIYTYNYSPLSVFDGNTWDIDISENEFFNKSTRAVAKDYEGNTWIGTTDGLYKMTSENVFEQVEVLCEDTITSVQCIGTFENIIWVKAAGSNIYKFDGDIWTKIDMSNLSINYASRMFVRDANEIWFIKEGVSAYKFSNNEWTVYDSTQGFLPYQPINDICFYGDSIWFATRYGAALLYNSELSFYCNDSSFSSGYSNLQTVQVDKNGLVWFGNKKGAMTYDGETINYIQPSGYQAEIYTIREDPNRNLWFCGSNAISKYTFDNSGIENPTIELKMLTIYPNPATVEFSFELPTEIKNDILEIYSLNGSVIFEQAVTSGHNFINISNLNPGMYLVRLREKGIYGKIVIE